MTYLDQAALVGAIPFPCGREPGDLPDRLPDRRAVGHAILPDGGVRLTLPRNGVLTDAEARRLAWAILNDLSPDEVVPAADVVTYKEGQRLAVLRLVGRRVVASSDIAQTLGWGARVTQRRLEELVGDGRLSATGRGLRGRMYRLVKGDVAGSAR